MQYLDDYGYHRDIIRAEPIMHNRTNRHYLLYIIGIFSFTQTLTTLGPFISSAPLAGCAIALSPQPGNKLALPK